MSVIAPKIGITKLDNGITVISQNFDHVETVALGTWFRAGARDEQQDEHGIAHMLEHMAFKGTSKRSAQQIAEEIEFAGGDINAATSMETTSYTARVLKEEWRNALNVIADIVCDPQFDDDEMAREQGVVLQEIAASNDMPDDVVYDIGHEAAFPKQSIGRPILGTAQSVSAFGPEHLVSFRNRHYVSENMVVAATGKVNHQEFVEQVAKDFADQKTGAKTKRPAASFSNGCSLVEKPLDQTHILMSFPSVGYLHDDVYAMQVLSIILGGGMSSKLFQKVREERGLCYSVYAHITAFQDTGLFSVYAGTAPDQVEELIDVTTQTILSMENGAGEQELLKAKNQIKAAIVMSLESTAGRAEQLARQYLAIGKVRDTSEIVAKIEAVTMLDIKRLAREVFSGGQLSLAAVGSMQQRPDFDKVIKPFTA